MKRHLPNIRKSIVLVAISALLALGVLEVVISFAISYSPELSSFAYNPYERKNFDRITDWKSLNAASACTFIKPGHIVNDFVVNSHGFISEELPYEKPKDTIRILLLGDSYATGTIPYRYHFFPLLQAQLNTHPITLPSKKYEAINLGIPCGGTELYRKALEVEGQFYQPDLVLLSFFIGNDFIDDVNPAATDYIDLNKRLDSSIGQFPRIFYKSKLYTVLSNLIRIKQYSVSPHTTRSAPAGVAYGTHVAQEKPYDPYQPNLKAEAFLELEAIHSHIYRNDSDAYDYLPRISENILAIKQLSEHIGANFLVIVFPEQMQINPKLTSDVQKFSGTDSIQLLTELPSESIKTILDKHRIPAIYMAEDLRNALQRDTIYQPNDTHLNSIGNEISANVIYKYLQNHPELFSE